MAKLLTGVHAEDVGNGRVVEPGQPIPDDADPDIVNRLQDDGKLADDRRQSRKKTERET